MNPQTFETPTFAALLADAVTKPGTISTAYTAFHNYSLGNQLLALWQCHAREIPAGPISTYPGWQSKGRQVRKGEKAIVLCQPITMKKATETAAAGTLEPEFFTRFTYRAKWFVLSQTDGADLEPATPIAWDRVRALETLEITEIPFTALDGNCHGYATKRSIAVSPVAPESDSTRFHEIAHVLLGHTTAADKQDNERTPRDMEEIEAEAVALICLEALGLPGADHCRGYIQHWNRSGQAIPEKSAQRIMKTADAIIKAGKPAPAPTQE